MSMMPFRIVSDTFAPAQQDTAPTEVITGTQDFQSTASRIL